MSGRPKALTPTTICMALCNPLGYAFVDSSLPQILVATLIVLVSYAFIWFYWKGRNWARILVLATSVISFLNLFGMAGASQLQQTIIVVEAGLGVFLLVWLNQKAVRDYFKNGGEP